MTTAKEARTPARLFVTNNLNLACALLVNGLKFCRLERDTTLCDFLLEDPSDQGNDLSQQFYERHLKVDALTLLDARAMLMGMVRRREASR